MKKLFSSDIVIALGLLAVLFFCFKSLNMPTAIAMLAHSLLVIGYIVFALFFWRERAADEREQAHQMFAARVALIVGAGVLVLAIVVESFVHHEVDPWLVYALAAMVFAKIGARMYSAEKH